ncbi:uncharacterized protein STEHIDRAFT_164157 [Stereum hirsutum FP-91666 SS1]|uniref:Uncharacterized protein n=1 Tax=Stereum hirsutum (strain FP-91666) TaxID=721885 RepID=R7RX46_STEHR|nr:uncharacterized protein STEHIDRAFT_164157 [Stereum hirsutum FP-91666 SS1]EIM78962.1 hypothetical protein STEHIDRAFT_164157 [Stereum hirsutum FP-91666 SS1]
MNDVELDDPDLAHNVPAYVLDRFREWRYSSHDIQKDPGKFIGTAWVDAAELRTYLKTNPAALLRSRAGSEVSFSGSAPPSRSVSRMSSVSVKMEPGEAPAVKSEPTDDEVLLYGDVGARRQRRSSASSSAASRWSSFIAPDGTEGLELLDSDDEVASILGTVPGNSSRSSSRSYTPTSTSSSLDGHDTPCAPDDNTPSGSLVTDIAATVWHDESVQSVPELGSPTFFITRQCRVKVLETVHGLPHYYPIPRVSTGYVLDLRDPQYDFSDLVAGKRPPPDRADSIILNRDQDSWASHGAGKNCTTADIPGERFGLAQGLVKCRRVRMECKGTQHCEDADLSIISGERFELEPEKRAALFDAQTRIRIQEGMDANQRVATFWRSIQTRPCPFPKCGGGLSQARYQNGAKNGKTYFIGCTGFRRGETNPGHRYIAIPTDVDEHRLSRIIAGQPLPPPEDSDSTSPIIVKRASCSFMVHGRIGRRAIKCKFTHIVDGVPTTMKTVTRACPASRTIFVPMDASLQRLAIVVPDHTSPHNHPMPPFTKVDADDRQGRVNTGGARRQDTDGVQPSLPSESCEE